MQSPADTLLPAAVMARHYTKANKALEQALPLLSIVWKVLPKTQITRWKSCGNAVQLNLLCTGLLLPLR